MARDSEMMNYSSKSKIEGYWKKILHEIATDPMMYRDSLLPLARIKRLMKVEQEVSKVASEVPVMFSKISEIFIEELTLRAWMHTEESKRRILQRGDICAAAKASDVFDFLIYLIPRNGALSLIENNHPMPAALSEQHHFPEKAKLEYPRYHR